MKRKIGFIGIFLAFAIVAILCYAETVGVGIWDYTNNAEYWNYVDGDWVPGTDSTVTIGASGTEVKNIHLEAITLAGTEYTSLAMGSDGNWTGAGTTTYLDSAPAKFVATHSSGDLACTGFTVGTGDITFAQGGKLDGDTNNSLKFVENSDTTTIGHDGDDTLISASDGSIELYPQNDATEGTVDFLTGGDTDDFMYVKTTSNVPTIATSGTANLAIVPDGGTLALTGILTVSGAQTLTGATTATSLIIGDDTYDVVVDDEFRFASNDEATLVEAYGFEAKNAGFQFTCDEGDDAGDKGQIVMSQATNSFLFTSDTAVKDTHATILTLAKTGIMTTTAAINVEKDDSANNAVADVLNLQHFTSGTAAAGIGTGLTFDLENANGTEEEHASIDIVSAVATDGSEDTDVVVNLMTNGALAEVLRIDTDNEADAGTVFELTSRTEETNGVIDMLELELDNTLDTANDGMGLGISILMDDETDVVEQQASIDFVLTDVTTTAENVDIILSANTIGTIREVFHVDTDNTATDNTLFQMTSWTLETDGVRDVLELNLDNTADTATDNFGLGISIVMEQEDDGTPVQQASVDFTLVDSTTATEDCDVIVSQATAGAVAETLRLVANSSSTTSDYMQFTANTTETTVIHPVLVLATATGTAENGHGVAISFRPEDATASEEQARIDVTQTTAANATNDTDFVFTQNVNGALEERVRFDADDDTILLTGTLPKMTIGDGGDEDAILTFDGQTNDFYMGFDTTDDLLNIGVGSTPGTTCAIEIDASANVIIASSMKIPYQIHAAADTLTINEGMKLHVFDNATEYKLTLPSAATSAGIHWHIVLNLAPSGTAYTIGTHGGENLLFGVATVNGAVVGCQAQDLITFTADAAVIGDYVDLYCDGVNWYVSGTAFAATGIAFTVT